MRVRVNNKLTNEDAFFRQYDQNHNLVASADRIGVAQVGEKQTTYDVVTPDYFKRRSKGEIIINPFSSVHYYATCTFSGVSVKVGTANPAVWNDYVWTGPYLAYWMNGVQSSVAPDLITRQERDRLVAIASTKCWGAVSASKVQLLQTLADIKRTIELVRHPLASAESFVRKARNRKNSSWSDRSLTVAKYMAREWLTYRYGWRQLYLDVKGVLDAVGTHERTGLLQTRANTKTRSEVSETLMVKANNSTFEIEVSKSTQDELYVKCGLFYDGKLDVPKYLGLTYLDVLAAAWDIIPYSFVIDWVVDVQSYLSALTPFYLVPARGAYTTLTRVKTLTHQVTGQVNMLASNWIQYGSVTSAPSGIAISIERSKTRIKGIGDPSLSLVANIGDLVSIRVLDSIALILNILRNK